jgi:hypothetical protein
VTVSNMLKVTSEPANSLICRWGTCDIQTTPMRIRSKPRPRRFQPPLAHLPKIDDSREQVRDERIPLGSTKPGKATGCPSAGHRLASEI